MTRTYEAILKGDRVEWSGESPNAPIPIRVQITVLDEPAQSKPGGPDMAAALQDLARGGLAKIEDPVAWQQEQRRDRALPTRGDGSTD